MNYQLSKYINNYTSYLILSVPFFSVLSIFFLEIILLILSISFLIECIKRKNFSYFNNFFFKFFLIFYFYILINFFIQVDKIDTLSVIFYFRYALYTLSIYFYLSEKPNLFLKFLKIVCYCIIILGFDAIIQNIFGYNIIGLKIVEINRSSSFFENELILGSFIFRLLPFVFMLLILDISSVNKYLKYFLVILSFITITLSGERTSILLSLLFFLIIIFSLKDLKKFLFFKYIFAFIIILFVIILTFADKYRYRYFVEPLSDLSYNYKVTEDLLAGYSQKPKIIFFSGLHHNLMITSLRIFNDNKLFGSGPRSYRNECKNYKINRFSCDTHPHNYYLQLLSEIGLIGLSFLIIVYLLILKEIFLVRKDKNTKNSNLKICILCFYLAALWPIIPSGNFFNNWLSIMTYLPISFYLFLDNNYKKN